MAIQKEKYYNAKGLVLKFNELIDSINNGIGGSNSVFESLIWASSVNLNHAISTNSTLNLSGNTTFTGSGYTQNVKKTVRIVCDGVTRNLTFPGGWKFIGDVAPVTLAAGKVGILEMFCWGSTEADVTVIYSVQP